MKTIKKITALVAVLVLTFSLVACGKASVVGTWKAEQDGTVATYEFKKDGTGSVSIIGITLDITYKTEGEKLSVTMSFLGQSDTQEYTYSVKGKKLTLTADGDSVVFDKQ